MNNVKTVGFIVAALLLMGASFMFGSMQKEIKMLRSSVANVQNYAAPTQDDSLDAIPQITYDNVAPIDGDDHISGNKDAKLALIEYSDFECPYCKSFHATAEQFIKESNGEIKWVYRHFPLRSIHPNALISAVGSECVAKLLGDEAFWTYGNALMANQNLSKQLIIDEAVKLGADETSFSTCLEDKEILSKIDNDEAEGAKTGIRGTPGNIIVNTETGAAQILPGALPLQNLKQAFEAIK